MSNGRKTLKRRLFQRDGWRENGHWRAHCAFGCGAILHYSVATIDHYPIPRRFGGPYTLDNTRLACKPCNTTDGGRAGVMTKIVPQKLTPLQRRQWWQANRDVVETVEARGGRP